VTSSTPTVEPYSEGSTPGDERISAPLEAHRTAAVLPPLTRREALARERAAVEAALLPEPTPLTVSSADDLVHDAVVDVLPAGSGLSDATSIDEAPVVLGRRAQRLAEQSASRAVPRRSGPKRTVRTAAPVVAEAVRSVAAPRPSRSRPSGRRRTQRVGVVGAMLFVGATIVSTSVPANAYFIDTPEQAAVKLAAAAQSGRTVGGTGVPAADAQQLTAASSVEAESVGRDGYSVSALAPTSAGASSAGFSNDANAAVQWPFASSVPISSGFGARQVANCGFCSTNHQGLDFIPGAGTPIQSIADGVVSRVELGGGALGYNVWIDHVIDGQKITTVSAHMQAGSVKVATGQQIKVGQVIGLVGSTGNSTGAHLHFEVHLGTLPVDPYPWLVAHAGVA
jgi:murein DD-endopeptidase MepM/ murein hydrolase activator NlpD